MLGIDLVYIPEFKKQLDMGGKTFLNKVFNTSELGNESSDHLAGVWAAKEAVIKAAEITPKKFTDIIISYDKSGKPRAEFMMYKFEVSIAHHGEYAVAVAFRQKDINT